MDFCIENATLPTSQEELKELLTNAKEYGYKQGHMEAINQCEEGRHEGRGIHNQEQMKEALRKQQINWEYIFKSRLKRIEGVFRLPQEWDQVTKLMEEQKP